MSASGMRLCVLNHVAVAWMALSFGTTAAADEPRCFPACRDGYLCHEGECIEACNPPCEEGYQCTASRQCAPDTAAAGGQVTLTDLIGRGPELTGRYFAVGFGPEIGEHAGGGAELEVGFGSARHHFAILGSGGGGLSFGGNAKALGSGALGWRAIFGDGPMHFTLLVGLETGYMVEFEEEEAYTSSGGYRSDIEYEYVIPMARVGFGWWWPMSRTSFWSIEITGNAGQRIHVNASENPFGEDYSGFTGFFRTRVRFIF